MLTNFFSLKWQSSPSSKPFKHQVVNKSSEETWLKRNYKDKVGCYHKVKKKKKKKKRKKKKKKIWITSNLHL